MSIYVLGERPLRIADVVRAAQGPLEIVAPEAVKARMAAARAAVEAHLADGTPVYGLNTGLGGNIDHKISALEMAGFQARMVRARVAGIGGFLPAEACRAALFTRIAGLATGGAGLSPEVFDLMAAMLARDVIPVLPKIGSIGAGDLIVSMSMAHAVIGEGQVYFGGRILDTADAMRACGLQPVGLGAKDGLGIANASAVTAALAALALDELGNLLRMQVAVAALAFEGYGANPRIFDERIASARPATGQVEAAGLFRTMLDGSSLHAPDPARKVQDAISFRTLTPVTGTVLAAWGRAVGAVEIELNGMADNPLVLESGAIHSSANFHTPEIALAFDMLAIGLAHLATASAQRSIKLMTGRLSGLPNYLSPLGGASAGFVPMQKALAALHGEIRLKAAPASLDALVVSDTVEDLAPMTPLTITKLGEQILSLRWMITLEAMFAAQAVSLRGESGLGAAGALLQPIIRAVVAPLEADRATGPDADALHARLWAKPTLQKVQALFAGSASVLSPQAP